MTQAQALEINRLRGQVYELEIALARQKEATSHVLNREARVRVALEAQGLSREQVDAIAHAR